MDYNAYWHGYFVGPSIVDIYYIPVSLDMHSMLLEVFNYGINL